MLESWGCGLYTSAAYTRVFTVAGQTENGFECGFVEHGLNFVLNIWPFPCFSSFLLTSVDQNLKLILVTKYFYNHPQRAQSPYTVHVMLLVIPIY